jgi:hypothetical protein
VGDVSGETAAWIAVLGALGGALIGATVGGIVDFILDRVRERREAMVGARLARADISTAASYLKDAEDNGQWWVFFETPMEGWHAHRPALSGRLTPEEFEVVSQSVMELERFGKAMRQSPFQPGSPYEELPEASLRRLNDMRTDATAAFNTLQRLAGGERITTGLLHDKRTKPHPPEGVAPKG